jgi:hypothetical protein
MPWTDVMEDTGNCATNTIIETFDRVGMDEAAGVFPIGVANRVMCREGFTNRREGFPLIAHEMRRHVDILAQHPACFSLGQIGHDPSPGFASFIRSDRQ